MQFVKALVDQNPHLVGRMLSKSTGKHTSVLLKSINMYLHVSKPSTNCFKIALVFQGTCVVYTQALCSEIESNFFSRTTFSQLLKANGVCALCFNFLVFCSRLLHWRVVFGILLLKVRAVTPTRIPEVCAETPTLWCLLIDSKAAVRTS